MSGHVVGGLCFLLAAWSLFVGLAIGVKWGRVRGAERERNRLVRFARKAASAARMGEPGPVQRFSERAWSPLDWVRFADVIEHEDDRAWLAMREQRGA